MRCQCGSDMVLLAAPCHSKRPLPKASVEWGSLQAPAARTEGYLFSFLGQLLLKPPVKLVTLLERPVQELNNGSSGAAKRVFNGQQQSFKMFAKAEVSLPACSPIGNPHDTSI